MTVHIEGKGCGGVPEVFLHGLDIVAALYRGYGVRIRGDTPESILRVLMKHVAFRAPSLSLGVSGLTRAILCSGDTRLLHTALEQGLIPSEEPIERLLELAGRNSAVRSLLLTQARRSLGCAPAGAEKNSYRLLSDDEAERVLCDPMLRAQASDALLRLLDGRAEERLGLAGKSRSACVFETQSYAALCAFQGETETVLRFAVWQWGGGMEETTTERVWHADATAVLEAASPIVPRYSTIANLLGSYPTGEQGSGEMPLPPVCLKCVVLRSGKSGKMTYIPPIRPRRTSMRTRRIGQKTKHAIIIWKAC